MRSLAGSGLVPILVVVHIPYVVRTVFNGPMSSVESKKPFRPGLLWRKRGDTIHGFGLGFAGFQGDSFPIELEDLPAVGECEVVAQQGGGAEGSDFKSAVAFVDCLVLRGIKSLARGA